jgi:hypothetical protein
VLDDRHELVEIPAVGRVDRPLGGDQVRAAPVVARPLGPGRLEHTEAEHQREAGRRERDPTGRRPITGEPGRRPRDDAGQPRQPDARDQDRGEVDSHYEAVDLDIAEPRKDVQHPAPGRTPEEEQEAQREGAQERPGAQVSTSTGDAAYGADEEQNREDREPAVVEEVAREEPAKDLARTVGVVEDRARVDLAPGRPLRVADQGDEDPGGDE